MICLGKPKILGDTLVLYLFIHNEFHMKTPRLECELEGWETFVILPQLPLSTYLSIYLSIYLWLCSPLLDRGRLFSFLIFCTVCRTPWTGVQPVARPLPAHTGQIKRPQTSVPWVWFEPTIPAFERAKTVHALDRAAKWSAPSKLLA
jgi:hypothetical protein